MAAARIARAVPVAPFGAIFFLAALRKRRLGRCSFWAEWVRTLHPTVTQAAMRLSDADDCHWLSGVLDRFEGPLVRYAQRITGNLEQARDVAQDTFLRLVREGRGVADGHLAQWLFTVCRRRAIDVRKKEFRMNPMTAEEAESCESREAPQHSAIEAGDEAAKIARLLAALPASQQEAVRLKFQEGLSYRDIAAVTGLSVTNVGYLLHAALKTVRRRMSEHDGAP